MFDFELHTKLHETTWDAFVRDFGIGRKDLLVTNRPIVEEAITTNKLDCRVIRPKDYGHGEPNDKMINKMMADIRELDFDRIIAIGGGTVIDIAKALTLEPVDDIVDILDFKIKPKRIKGLVVIPTTCGSGSEVTSVSVIGDTNTIIKKAIDSPEVYPDHAVLIPELLMSAPYQVLATSSVDALIHAVESYLAPKSNPVTELFSVPAVESILKAYRQIASEGEKAFYANIAELLLASTYAGIAFVNTGVATIHAMSGQLGGAYHVPHGESNYVLFDVVLRAYERKNPTGKIAALKKLITKSLELSETADPLEEMNELIDKVIPLKRMREYGIKETDIDPFTDATMAQPWLMKNSNVPLSREDVRDIYAAAY